MEDFSALSVKKKYIPELLSMRNITSFVLILAHLEVLKCQHKALGEGTITQTGIMEKPYKSLDGGSKF